MAMEAMYNLIIQQESQGKKIIHATRHFRWDVWPTEVTEQGFLQGVILNDKVQGSNFSS